MRADRLFAALCQEDQEVGLHSQRAERYCAVLGQALGLSPRELRKLSLLSLFHDIGKTMVDPAVLHKPGPLTPAEWDEIKRHPELGRQIARGIPSLAPIAELIFSHHEQWDGTGYPQGLRGREIPHISRMIAVVDAFDAMTSDRLYRPAMPMEDAVLEIEKNAGRQFDPDIAVVFLAIQREARVSLPPK